MLVLLVLVLLWWGDIAGRSVGQGLPPNIPQSILIFIFKKPIDTTPKITYTNLKRRNKMKNTTISTNTTRETNSNINETARETNSSINETNSNINNTLTEITELYFRGGNLNEILKVAKEEGYGKKLHKIWTSLELRKAKEMREEGNTYKEIAEKLGRNAKGVSQRLYRYEGGYSEQRRKKETIKNRHNSKGIKTIR